MLQMYAPPHLELKFISIVFGLPVCQSLTLFTLTLAVTFEMQSWSLFIGNAFPTNEITQRLMTLWPYCTNLN